MLTEASGGSKHVRKYVDTGRASGAQMVDSASQSCEEGLRVIPIRQLMR